MLMRTDLCKMLENRLKTASKPPHRVEQGFIYFVAFKNLRFLNTPRTPMLAWSCSAAVH